MIQSLLRKAVLDNRTTGFIFCLLDVKLHAKIRHWWGKPTTLLEREVVKCKADNFTIGDLQRSL